MSKKYRYNNTLNSTSVPSRFDLYKEGNVLTIDKDGYVVQKEPQGGSGGTSNYNDLSNKPQIDGVELVGNKTAEALGLTSLDVFTEEVSTLNNAIKDNTKHINTLNSQYNSLNINKVDTDLLNVNVGEGKENKVLSFDASGNPKFVEQGGSGGTNNYEELTNQPQVNGVTLLGNKTSADLSLASSQELSETNSNLQLFKNYVDSALTKKDDELDLILNDNVKVALSNEANNINILGQGKSINFPQGIKSGNSDVATKHDLIGNYVNDTTTNIIVGTDLAADQLILGSRLLSSSNIELELSTMSNGNISIKNQVIRLPIKMVNSEGIVYNVDILNGNWNLQIDS